MSSKNYRMGAGFEARFIKQLVVSGDAVKAGRFYASKGITDVWWCTQYGIHNEAQLKYSSKRKPYISPKEFNTLQEFANKMKGIMPVWLVTKQAHKKLEMRCLNA